MSGYEELLTQALSAAEILSPTSHAWFGAPASPLAPETELAMGGEEAKAYLLYNLQARLYGDFYCAGAARRPVATPSIHGLPGHSPFVQALSGANVGTGALEGGWTVVREEEGSLVVARDGLSLWLAPTDVRLQGGGEPAGGTAVSVLMPKELLRLSPGFYMALGDVQPSFDGSTPILRLYWHLRGEGAVALVRVLTERLNAAGIGFRLKVVSDPSGYSRCDAGVLYVRSQDYEALRDPLARTHGEIAPLLRAAVPALTKRLRPGLGLAEDPGLEAVSFGMSRCRLLAEAIVEAAERGIGELAERLEVVRERFAREGLALQTPYLNSGSEDRYELGDG